MNANVKRLVRAAHDELRGTDSLGARIDRALMQLSVIDLIADLSSDPTTGAMVVEAREDGITHHERAHRITRLFLHVHTDARSFAFDRAAWGSFFWN